VDLPIDLIPLFKHSQDCLAQCFEIEAGCNGDTVYPLVLKNHTVASVSSIEPPLSIHASSIGTGITNIPSNNISPLPSLDTVFLDRVGWCVRTGEVYTMLFCDGGRMVVDGGRGVVWWRGSVSGEEEKYGIEWGLPRDVRERLGYLERFLGGFK
jgi:hypothetical protein